ncbi:breast cancer anti-estrogen resistance protein 3 homolog isoform X3 [Apostichopus japonicus]
MTTFNLSTDQWLKTLDLEEYVTLFKKYDMMEDLLYWTEADLQTVGVTNPAHRARLASNLVFIRDKLRRSTNPSGPFANSYSPLSFSPRTPKTPLSSGPPGSPSTRFSFRYSTIPEGGVSTLPLSPTKPKMDVKHSSAADLRRELELEFKLPNSDIRSHAWFHGGISREQAQTLVKSDGDFLVRDSISKPGNYVLTVMWRNAPMHFVINKIAANTHSSYASYQYQFEKESFDNVPGLIRYHIGNRRAISAPTKAIITNPINRNVPLSAMDGRYAISPTNDVYSTTNKVITPKKMTLDLKSSSRERSGSIPSILSPTGFLKPSMGRSESQPSISPVSPTAKELPSPTPDSGKKETLFQRTGSEPILNQNEMGSPRRKILEDSKHSGSDSDLMVKVSGPPKPVRTPSIHAQPFPEMDEDIYSEISPVDEPVHVKYLSLKDKEEEETSADDINHERLEKRKRVTSDTRNSVLETLDGPPLITSPKLMEDDEDTEVYPRPNYLQYEEQSTFHPELFTSDWLGEENKPLDASVVSEMRRLIMATPPLTLAKHLTVVDIESLRVTDNANNNLPGLELITLPQGSQLRQDILERYKCLKVWCSICILTCPDQEERLRMMEHWINLADSLRSNFGNLFGFGAIMDAMCSPAMMYMRSVWDGLRSHHTNSAVLYDTKLRSLLKSLNIGENAFPLPQISIPYVIPICQLMERDWTYLSEQDWSQQLSKETLENFPVGETWEDSAVNFGLDAMMGHLRNAHRYSQQMEMYSAHAQSKVNGYKTDRRILDLFRTEFHMRLLWGSKGAVVDSRDRHQKFDLIMKVMSTKIEEASMRA